MKILIVNTSNRGGGAAIAAVRLKTALLNLGEKPRMLVATKEGNDFTTFGLKSAWRYKLCWAFERLGIFLRQGLSKAHLWDIDPATHGVDITALPEFKEADIIHLHWVNQGFLSFKILNKVLHSSKPVVWTMHDAWTFTGLCHSPLECTAFRRECGNCMLLRRAGQNDWSHRLWRRKQALFEGTGRLVFVACSRWLADMARSSTLLADRTVVDIPNPIDTHLFTPGDKEQARMLLGLPQGKSLILFSAYSVNAPIKGLTYLREALAQMAETEPSMRDRVAVVLTGRGAEQMAEPMPVEAIPMGYVTDPKRMALIYNAVDAFCLPSLQENLPNTIMEAKACGVPTVAFRVGGIPQMIDHRADGYLAEPKDAADLAQGLRWVLAADAASMRQLNRAAAVEQYSEARVAERYLKLYQQLIDHGKPVAD
ncbi:MAG: glycosyltransferase family 4 protein [Bacteroidaceae bacterium]|nr:glycosyltransferase family 4 protein [Bacteroidaceae bacterium]